jgi:tRNA pseudouridine38-40 synthase
VGPLRRVMLQVSYDGTGFHGFARQPNGRTVGGELAAALEAMVGGPVELVCAGRTDTGVHASGQVVHVDVPASFLVRRPRRKAAAGDDSSGDLTWLATALTRQLGPEVAVTGAAVAADGFDARRSALSRRYRYHVLNRPAPDPLLSRTSWHVPAELDLNAMRIASDVLLGEHDFAAFCRRPPGSEAGTPIRRRVLDTRWSRLAEPEGLLRFEIEAQSFCHQMVRSLVAALVAAGEGRMTAAAILGLLRSGERAGAPAPAPARGLCLVAVRYPPDLQLFAAASGLA